MFFIVLVWIAMKSCHLVHVLPRHMKSTVVWSIINECQSFSQSGISRMLSTMTTSSAVQAHELTQRASQPRKLRCSDRRMFSGSPVLNFGRAVQKYADMLNVNHCHYTASATPCRKSLAVQVLCADADSIHSVSHIVLPLCIDRLSR